MQLACVVPQLEAHSDAAAVSFGRLKSQRHLHDESVGTGVGTSSFGRAARSATDRPDCSSSASRRPTRPSTLRPGSKPSSSRRRARRSSRTRTRSSSSTRSRSPVSARSSRRRRFPRTARGDSRAAKSRTSRSTGTSHGTERIQGTADELLSVARSDRIRDLSSLILTSQRIDEEEEAHARPVSPTKVDFDASLPDVRLRLATALHLNSLADRCSPPCPPAPTRALCGPSQD
jgi:hypothetical protein